MNRFGTMAPSGYSGTMMRVKPIMKLIETQNFLGTFKFGRLAQEMEAHQYFLTLWGAIQTIPLLLLTASARSNRTTQDPLSVSVGNLMM